MAIEHKSNNMEYIEKYAKRHHSEDITYSAKGIFNAIDVNWWECYYLISPDKKVVYRAEKLGDYSEIINKMKIERVHDENGRNITETVFESQEYSRIENYSIGLPDGEGDLFGSLIFINNLEEA